MIENAGPHPLPDGSPRYSILDCVSVFWFLADLAVIDTDELDGGAATPAEQTPGLVGKATPSPLCLVEFRPDLPLQRPLGFIQLAKPPRDGSGLRIPWDRPDLK